MGLHGGNLRAARDKYGDLEFLDFSANINPLGPPETVFKAINKHLPKIVHYPDPQGLGLKNLLSEKLGISKEQLILGNGAVELVYLLVHALQPKSALIPVPTFSEYSRALQGLHTQIRYSYLTPESGFRLDLNEMELAGCDILFICNPNNPTGNLLSQEEFVQILDLARLQGTFVVVDESFIDFVGKKKQWRAIQFLREYDRLFVLYSLTKFYAIPGLRLGCGIGSPDMISRLDSLKDPWNVNNLALAAGEAALVDVDHQERTRKIINQERNFLTSELAQIPFLNVFPGSANFLLVENQSQVNGENMVELLGKQGILIRNCQNFPGLGANYFRVAVKDRESNLRLLKSLIQVLG